jgi:hypothetical protein
MHFATFIYYAFCLNDLNASNDANVLSIKRWLYKLYILFYLD